MEEIRNFSYIQKSQVFPILLVKLGFSSSEIAGLSDSEIPGFSDFGSENSAFLNSQILSYSDLSSEKSAEKPAEKPGFSEFRNTEHFGIDCIIIYFSEFLINSNSPKNGKCEKCNDKCSQ